MTRVDHSFDNVEDIKNLIKTLKASGAKNLVAKFTIPSGEFCQTAIWIDSLSESDLIKGIPISGVFDGMQSLVNSDAILRIDPATISTDIAPIHRKTNSVVGIGSIFSADGQHEVNTDPRHVAQKAIEAMKRSGIGDQCLIGPELEFSVFDDVTFEVADRMSSFSIVEPEYKKDQSKAEQPNISSHPIGLMPLHYVPEHKDTLFEVRSKILENIESFGFCPRTHLHEDNQGQCEVVVNHDNLVLMADYTQLAKLTAFKVAESFEKVATFMPFPFTGRPGNGHHVNLSLWKDGKNIFANSEPNKLSSNAQYFIGGILKHVKALNCICNPTINSYRRLAAHFNIYHPVGWGENNRTSAIRIPSVSNPEQSRLEIRFPDNTANPYYSYSAILLAGLDGIRNKTRPEDMRVESNLKPPFLHTSGFARDLYDAALNLDVDREFLKYEGVFDDGIIDFICHRAVLMSQQGVFTTSPLDFEQSFSI